MPRYRSGPKKGEYLTWSQWFTAAGQGIQNITPLQQAKSERVGQLLNLIGIVCGIIVMAWQWKNFWWTEIILTGALLLTAVGLIGVQKRIKTFSDLEKLMAGATNE